MFQAGFPNTMVADPTPGAIPPDPPLFIGSARLFAAMVADSPHAGAGNVRAFPPQACTAAEIADAMEQCPGAALLPLARAAVSAAIDRAADTSAVTLNLHAVWCAMLACVRVLDAAAYPWNGAPMPASLPTAPVRGAA